MFPILYINSIEILLDILFEINDFLNAIVRDSLFPMTFIMIYTTILFIMKHNHIEILYLVLYLPGLVYV